MKDRREYLRQYRIKNKERLKELSKKKYEENKSFYLMYSKTRKATIKRACPNSLSSEDFEQIKQIYLKCKIITEQTGIEHHVDHIIPLRGENVCGLHVPWNLQIITAEENLRKSNKYE